MKGGDIMPNRDGTGPAGQGSMTGRGMGNCTDKSASPTRPPLGLGRRSGQPRGRGSKAPARRGR